MAAKVQEKTKTRKNGKLRYSEYYDQQNILDELYQESSDGKIFNNLMSLITSDANILRAYRSIKSNSGSVTPGTDRKTIKDIEAMNAQTVCNEVRRRLKYYQPKAVRRKEIPKPNGKTRPLGIPCIWDRLIQQCIFQILEPICEAKFSENSYGFRPMRSVENAIAAEMKLINLSKLQYVIEVDIKSFFDEVNHEKLMRQIWAMGIRDKKLISIIKAILKAPILLPDKTVVKPDKGTPQGGILSPLLANIVLNEFDRWIESQWETNPITEKYCIKIHENGSLDRINGYRAMRKQTKLKEMRVIRYADDIRILCRTRSDAVRAEKAISLWLKDRLKLQMSEEKTRIVNLNKQYSEFLGFKMKAAAKANKRIVKSHVCDKAKKRMERQLIDQIKKIEYPENGRLMNEIYKYNSMIRGMHNYYKIATHVNIDFAEIAWRIKNVMKCRLRTQITKSGEIKRDSQDFKKYGKSKQLRFIAGVWILPVAYVQHCNPMLKKRMVNIYTRQGRENIQDELKIANKWIMDYMSMHPVEKQSIEYNDNRISLFAAQHGKCSITGIEFLSPDEVRCHHKCPRHLGGNDKYGNLALVLKDVHILIHATKTETIQQYLKLLDLNQNQIKKLNQYRILAGCEPV